MSGPHPAMTATPAAPGAAHPHALYLAVAYVDTLTGQHVQFSRELPRTASRTADIQEAITRLATAVDHVLQHADEASDATITLALLRQP